jgi:hypothetical protein
MRCMSHDYMRCCNKTERKERDIPRIVNVSGKRVTRLDFRPAWQQKGIRGGSCKPHAAKESLGTIS